jgi:ribose transport system substrate-binding protein
MRLVKPLIPVAVVGVIAVGATGAGAAPNAKTDHAQARLKIGYINHIDAIPFVQLVRKGIQAQGKKAGAQVLVCNPNGDAQKAVNCAAQLKAQKVNGIINFQPVEAAGPRVCAAGPKVPVIAIDIHQRPCEKIFYGADNPGAGRLAGRALGQFAKTKFGCKVDAWVSMEAPAVGVVNRLRMNGLLAGYKQVCSNPPNITRVDGKGATDPAIQPARDTLTRLTGKKKILVVSLNDDMAIGMIKAAESANRLGDIYVAAQGADPTSWRYICGKERFKNWVADTAYFPELYGSRVVPMLISLIDGQKQPKIVHTNHRVVTPKSIKVIYPRACR